eukprot:TRINITY_DN12576_c0_g2_i2.p2 TRINITY_DN12576_c0_g2~~TRINITY_DN12576_c0_g2_i2.p2  ORF type:complete len:102 (+),score=37.73 TRINITY_DN12576_c0_g2_i2:63-368(+)
MGLLEEEKNQAEEEEDEQPELEPIPPAPPAPPARAAKPEPNPASLKRSLQKISQSSKVKQELKQDPKSKKQRVTIVISDEEDEDEEYAHRQAVREVDLTQD